MERYGISRWQAAVPLSLLLMASMVCSASDQPASSAASLAASSGLYLKAQPNGPIKFTKLKPGDIVEGKLTRDVYSGDRELFPAGSSVRFTVDSLEKRRRIPNDHWPGVIKLFTPRHEKFPVFKTATVSGAGGQSALRVSLITVNRQREVVAQTRKKSSGQTAGSETGAVDVGTAKGDGSGKKQQIPPTMVLEAFEVENGKPDSTGADVKARSAPPLGPEVLPAGTRCKILLLGDVSASKSQPGDAVQARLLEPVLLDSHMVLPAGSLVEGKVVKKIPPRMLSRAGSLYLTFTGLTLPGGNQFPIAATLAAAELDDRSHTKIDKEGGLHGERPGKAWMAINLGVTAGVGKEADDTFQLIFEAIVSSATDASTAGQARIISGCASAIYLATRHGRDVILPRFTEMNISLDRPLSVNRAAD
ncbi:MAG: hypothetical protein WB729_17870 [Candidatus Sulfotelmatobacter sp.]